MSFYILRDKTVSIAGQTYRRLDSAVDFRSINAMPLLILALGYVLQQH